MYRVHFAAIAQPHNVSLMSFPEGQLLSYTSLNVDEKFLNNLQKETGTASSEAATLKTNFSVA